MLTIIVAVVGWLLANYVENLQATPIVKYSVSSIEDKSSFHWQNQIPCNVDLDSQTNSLYVYTITNLSKSVQFKNLTFYIKDNLSNDNGEVTSSRIIPHPPAIAGNEASQCVSESASYKGLTIHPSGSIDLVFGLSSLEGAPYILVASSSQAIDLQPSSFRTWLIENELMIIVFLIGLLVISFGHSVLKIKR